MLLGSRFGQVRRSEVVAQMGYELTRLTHEEWLADGERLFGHDFLRWRFVCPVCKHVAAVTAFAPYKDQGATPQSATCECIGRYQRDSCKAFGDDSGKAPKRPCDYAGYGLLKLSPVLVVFPDGSEQQSFAFDEQEVNG